MGCVSQRPSWFCHVFKNLEEGDSVDPSRNVSQIAQRLLHAQSATSGSPRGPVGAFDCPRHEPSARQGHLGQVSDGRADIYETR